jgi:anti-anti-sigma factor
MMIRESRDGEVSILHLSGSLTTGEGIGRLRHALRDVGGSGKRLVLDLSRVSYLDAAGIGELVRCHSQALREGGRLVMVGLRGKVEEVLGLAALLDQVEKADNPEEALKRISLSRLPRTAPQAV